MYQGYSIITKGLHSCARRAKMQGYAASGRGRGAFDRRTGIGRAMWWEKKPRSIEPQPPRPLSPPPATPKSETAMPDMMPRASDMNPPNQHQTILGQSMVLRGELEGREDLLVEGQFDGTINLQDHCLTIGPHGQVKADIHARQVVVQGSVTGDITAREKIEIRKTGHVVGGLVAAGVAIEDGAYFKGSIEILREQAQEAGQSLAAPISPRNR